MLAVFTHRNLPRMNPTPKPWSHLHPHGQGYLPLQDDKIHYAGQPLALVVAETRDKAAYAGTLIKVEYAAEPPVVFSGETAKEASTRRNSCGRSRRPSAMPTPRSRQLPSRSSRPTRRPIAITTRWSRMRRRRSGTRTAR